MKKDTTSDTARWGQKQRATGRRILELLNHMLVINIPDRSRVLPDT